MKIKLLGANLVIKLDQAKEHTKTDAGILIPLQEVYETDGGKIATRTSSKNYLSRGEVIHIGDKVTIPVNVGDKVYVVKHAVNPAYEFFEKRDSLVQDPSGLICIPEGMIEAIIE
jgi:co-chaperonin GroES (HSP10)